MSKGSGWVGGLLHAERERFRSAGLVRGGGQLDLQRRPPRVAKTCEMQHGFFFFAFLIEKTKDNYEHINFF